MKIFDPQQDYGPQEMKRLMRGTELHTRFVVSAYTFAGMALGSFAGVFLWKTLEVGFSWWYFLMGGNLLLGEIGRELGRVRVFSLQLQVQTALCQMKIEENTRPASPPVPGGTPT
ncbi:MAG TPA: hypothetical protein PK668_12555 [Myxococcota bacterium]|nr:hypothetical protein [Myxococcota bacterium]HRY93699.1 hypothetical protein [Myxococcota bacterium]